MIKIPPPMHPDIPMPSGQPRTGMVMTSSDIYLQVAAYRVHGQDARNALHSMVSGPAVAVRRPCWAEMTMRTYESIKPALSRLTPDGDEIFM